MIYGLSLTTAQLRKKLAHQRVERAEKSVSAYQDLIDREMLKKKNADERRKYWLETQGQNEKYLITNQPGNENYQRAQNMANYANIQKNAMYQAYLDYADNVDMLLIKKAAADAELSAAIQYHNNIKEN